MLQMEEVSEIDTHWPGDCQKPDGIFRQDEENNRRLDHLMELSAY